MTEKIVFKDGIITFPNKFHDILGKKFGRLLVLDHKGFREAGVKKTKKQLYDVICDCGTEKVVARDNLMGGISTSCGCKGRESLLARQKKERLPNGLSIWKAMLNSYVRQSAKDRGIFVDITLEQYMHICAQNCYYCGSKPIEKKFRNLHGTIYVNGIDRIDNTKGYTVDNSRPCCEYCNRMKLTKTETEFLAQVRAIYNHLLTPKTI